MLKDNPSCLLQVSKNVITKKSVSDTIILASFPHSLQRKMDMNKQSRVVNVNEAEVALAQYALGPKLDRQQ